MKNYKIDLRSDTMTIPTKDMLDCMISAKVGDDVWEEDETVKKLEKLIAKSFQHESALFCPSGTMTNQIAIRVHTKLGDELICDKLSHIYNYEAGGISSNSGVSTKLIDGHYGRIDRDMIDSSINVDDVHFPRTKLVCLENTVNKGGGTCYDIERIKEISKLCKQKKLGLHLDGARIFNAIVAKSHQPSDYGKLFDGISVCLSKGLGAPIGSLLIGSHDFINESRRVRKSFGGGMRQAGYLAAAGIYALSNNVKRLKKDHDKAQFIGECLSNLKYVKNIRPVETNIVLFDLEDSHLKKFKRIMFEKNIQYSFMAKNSVRFVTHLNFSESDLEKLIKVLKSLS